jgi:hypothetical protein
MYHLKEITYPVPGGLDLNIADEEEFSPDKLRANVERLYMTVVCMLQRIQAMKTSKVAFIGYRIAWDGQAYCPSSILERNSSYSWILLGKFQ